MIMDGHVHFEDLDFSHINKKYFKALAKQYKFLPLQNLLRKLNLC